MENIKLEIKSKPFKNTTFIGEFKTHWNVSKKSWHHVSAWDGKKWIEFDISPKGRKTKCKCKWVTEK